MPDYLAMETKSKADMVQHGVKGMKWGVRHDPGHEGQQAKTKQIEKLDKKFEKKVALANKGVVGPDFYNAAVSRINSRIRDINDSPKYRDVDIHTSGPLKDEYEKETRDAILKSYDDATREVFGSNASGTKKAVYNGETDQIELIDREAKHADGPLEIPNVTFQLKRDASGKVVSVDVVTEMQHHGIKGMKWGVRRSAEELSVANTPHPGASPVSGETSQERYSRIKTVVTDKKAEDLSDDDLRFFNNRNDALNRINKLNEANPNWIAETAKSVLQTVAKQQVQKIANGSANKYVSSPVLEQINKK